VPGEHVFIQEQFGTKQKGTEAAFDFVALQMHNSCIEMQGVFFGDTDNMAAFSD